MDWYKQKFSWTLTLLEQNLKCLVVHSLHLSKLKAIVKALASLFDIKIGTSCAAVRIRSPYSSRTLHFQQIQKTKHQQDVYFEDEKYDLIKQWMIMKYLRCVSNIQ